MFLGSSLQGSRIVVEWARGGRQGMSLLNPVNNMLISPQEVIAEVVAVVEVSIIWFVALSRFSIVNVCYLTMLTAR